MLRELQATNFKSEDIFVRSGLIFEEKFSIYGREIIYICLNCDLYRSSENPEILYIFLLYSN